ncbi:MAG: acetoacetyl-CoA reductase [Gammaproteobacteria bacterium]|nr:MAG: acetoacetyl-CoA reductase [Gammaproteobacteria bacterium]
MNKRIALVTGGIGGLGTAHCRALRDQGRIVVATYRPGTEERARAWQEERHGEGYEIHICPLDVSDYDSCKACVERIEQELGPVDILINNAGITRDRTMKKMTREEWDAVIEVDLSGAWNITRQVFPGMLERGWGRIVNISSINAQKGQFGQVNYSAAKAGLHGFTKALAREGARKGVTVNTISPGYIDTAMTRAVPKEIMEKIIEEIPVGHIGKPEDIARTVAFLTADEADYITGANFSINGGHHMF